MNFKVNAYALVFFLLNIFILSCSEGDKAIDPDTDGNSLGITLGDEAFTVSNTIASSDETGFIITLESEVNGKIMLETNSLEQKEFTIGNGAAATYTINPTYEATEGTITIENFENNIVSGSFDLILTRTDENTGETIATSGSFKEVAVGQDFETLLKAKDWFITKYVITNSCDGTETLHYVTNAICVKAGDVVEGGGETCSTGCGEEASWQFYKARFGNSIFIGNSSYKLITRKFGSANCEVITESENRTATFESDWNYDSNQNLLTVNLGDIFTLFGDDQIFSVAYEVVSFSKDKIVLSGTSDACNQFNIEVELK